MAFKNWPLWLKCTAAAVLCLLLGFLSGYSTSGSIQSWYADLEKPSFNPPNWIFGPVWSVLYIMMGVAFGLVWHQIDKDPAAKKGLSLFAIQFALNMLWTPLFFGAHKLLLAFAVILILWAFIFLTIRVFHKVTRPAGYLLIPYLLWVSFATVLNFSIWYLNM